MGNKIFGFVTFLLVLVIGTSCYFNYIQYQQNNSLQTKYNKKVETLKKIKDSENDEQAAIVSLESELENLQSENQILKNNDKDKNGTTKEFQETTEKLFEAMTTFDSSNYTKRKEASAPYLSKSLMEKYFDDSLTHGDSTGTESRLNELNVYGQVVQGETMKGIVVSRYESRVSDSDWNEGTDFYEVEYDTNSKKITKLDYVGKGITGGLSD